jgi:hypothetical protein
MTIRCFRWDDAGAPQLGAASSLSVVLEKCLVDGYGTQAGLGWGKIKSPSGKVIAFQPQARAASRPWLAFDDRCAGSAWGGVMNSAAPFCLFDVLTGLNDDGSAQAGSVNAIPFVSSRHLFYRRYDNSALPWFVIADSELDYFYLILPFMGNSVNGGVPGIVSNMGTEINRRGVVFTAIIFGVVPDSMVSSDTGSFIYPGLARQSAYTAGNDANGAPNISLNLAETGEVVYQFYKNGAGMFPLVPARLVNSPLMGAPTISVPNPYSNRLVLVPADIRLFCDDSRIFRGRLGGLVCCLNDSGAWRYGIDNCFSLLTQSIGGTQRKLLPILMPMVRISDGSKPTQAQMNYQFFDLTGPW